MKKPIAILYAALITATAFALPDDARRKECEKRARELVMKMTGEERATQLWMQSVAIKRLGVKNHHWWNEALHGVARAGLATVFPQSIGAAATFDTDLEYRMARIISIEGRAKRNLFAKRDIFNRYAFLTYWSPNVNLVRDPRWGRGQETFGEDPFLSSRMGVAFVRGLQGDNPKYLQAAGCAKHFAVHSGPENLRHKFDAVVSKRDLAEYYLPAFEALAREAKVEAFMGAYSSLNGDPCCMNKWLLTDLLRGEWGFKGHIVSDVGAVRDIYTGHKKRGSLAEAAKAALDAGLDLHSEWNNKGVLDAYANGLIKADDMIEPLVRLYTTRFLLGDFDPPGSTPWDDYGAEKIATEEHRAVALEMAEKSLVLVHNNGALPISPEKAGAVSVVGPLAASELPMRGNYNGQSATPVSVIAGVTAELGPSVIVQDEWGDIDTVIVCLGITSDEEGEEGCGDDNMAGDRKQYGISRQQLRFLKKCRSSGRLKRLIAVVFGGSPFDLKPVTQLCDAVIVAWYPGEMGAKAIARTIFGKASPSGRLPVTFPKSYEDLPAFTDYSLAGRTYRYAVKEPLYPFGYGLSYTSFGYSDLRIAPRADGKVDVAFKVRNTGKTAGDEVAQIYLRAPKSAGDRRKHHLAGFARTGKLAPGQEKTLTVTIEADSFSVFKEDGSKFIPEGKTQIFVGGGQPGFVKCLEGSVSLP